jgi:hypothetical protein
MLPGFADESGRDFEIRCAEMLDRRRHGRRCEGKAPRDKAERETKIIAIGDELSFLNRHS